MSYIRHSTFAAAGDAAYNLTEEEGSASAFVDVGPLEGQRGGVVLNKACEVVGMVQSDQDHYFGVFTAWTPEMRSRVTAAIQAAIDIK